MDSNHDQVKSHDITNAKGGSLKAKNTKKLILLITISILIIFGLTLKATTYIENPELCKRCHSMKFYYNTWMDSTHSTISCYACHIGYTPVKQVKKMPLTTKKYWALSFGEQTINISDYMNQLKELVASLNRRIEQFNRQVNFITARLQDLKKFFSVIPVGTGKGNIGSMWGNCLACHKDLGSASKTDNTGHFKHREIGLTCDQCHRNVVHGKTVTMSRAECMSCHKKPLAWPASHKTSAFRLEHGKEYLKRNSCTICHVRGSQEKICMDCHGVVMPHPKDYPSIHIQSIKPVGVQQCMKCHQDSDNKGTKKQAATVTCAKCHGPSLPHKRSGKLIVNHGKLVLDKGVPSCMNCHKPQNCTSCHGLEMPHPQGFLKQHTQSIKSLGFEQTCVNCHDKARGRDKMCSDCHGMDMPHPVGWKGNHSAGDASKCSKCHSPKNPVNPKAPWARKDFCSSCHGIKKHAENHWEMATLAVDCNKCHSQATCNKCH